VYRVWPLDPRFERHLLVADEYDILPHGRCTGRPRPRRERRRPSGATEGFPVGWYVATKAWAKKYPRTLAAFLDALRAGQQIADSSRTAVEQAMEKLPNPFTVTPVIAAVMSIENYPLNIAPNIDLPRVQRVADEMYQFKMLRQPFRVSTMLGGL
jgi:NitT/TauT family transport system substrate-binding protein